MLARLRGQLGPLRGRRLCVAFSGGADSTALLAWLAAARARGGFELRALHVNHQLQPGAAAWARAARAQARSLHVPCKVLRIAVTAAPGESPEAAARNARYRALASQLRTDEVLLTAHHLEDQAETLLLQLLRGAGLAGLAAMAERSAWAGGTLLRPLLSQPRAALRAWLLRHALPWTEDPSNADRRFDRNYLRHEVLPAILARWPGAPRTLARAATHLAEADALLATAVNPLLDRARAGKALRVSALRAHALPLRRQLLRQWLHELGLPPAPAARLAELAGPLLDARSDAAPEVRWQGARVRRHGGRLLAGPVSGSSNAARHRAAHATACPVTVSWRWREQSALVLADGSLLELQHDLHGDVLLAALPPVLQVGYRGAAGEGGAAAGGAAVKKLLQELRVAPRLRSRIPLISDAAGVVAIADLWVAARLTAPLSTAVLSNDTLRGRFRWRPLPIPD